MNSRSKKVLALAALAFAARLAVCWRFAHPGADGAIPDPDGYHRLATAALQYKTLAMPDGTPTAVRDPLFTLLLCALYVVFGPSYGLIIAMNVLLGVGLVLLVQRLGEKLFNEKVGFLASLLAALHPQLLYYTTQLLREIPQAFFVAATAVLAVEAVQRASRRFAGLAGVAGACVGLINTALLPGIGLVCVGIWHAGRRLGRSLLIHAVIYAVVCGGLYA
ncbi:MAG: glycosyltransferase family 39 protein, partial [Elusimicrobia bacterium]|nr:glycosyltransferase family 39 protein [Elusimicrobiota bacterium]